MRATTPFTIILLVLATITLSLPVSGTITTESSANYILIRDSLNFYSIDEADVYCQTNYGTSLASVHSTADNNEIVGLMGDMGLVGSERAWIGLIYWSGSYIWLDGTTFDYTNWAAAEPNIVGNSHVQIEPSGEWYDEFGTTTDYFICNQPEDVTPPSISISSPINSVYYSEDVNLTYSVSDGTTLVYLDDVANVTSLQSGTFLTGLSEGSHNLTIAATDLAGNVGTSTVLFNYDSTDPLVTIQTPLNSSYPDSVILNYSVSEGLTNVYLDGLANSSAIPSGTSYPSLTEGSHNFTITATDLAGNTGRDIVLFVIDRTAPTVVITSPMALNYSSQSIYLNYSTSPGLTTVYLDGVANMTTSPTGTLYSGLTWGWHNFTISTSDPAGNIGRDSVRFRLIEPTSTSTTSSTTTSTTTSTATSTTASSTASSVATSTRNSTTTSETSTGLSAPGFVFWMSMSTMILLVMRRKRLSG